MSVYKNIIIGAAMLIPFNCFCMELITNENINCTKTEEYIAYEKLSESEKSKYIAPIMCKETIEYSKNIRSVGGKLLVNPTSVSKFDLRNVNGKNYLTSVKNQQNTGLCWAHAGAAAVETSYLMNNNQEIDISELHMGYSTSYLLKDNYKNSFGYRYLDNDLNIVNWDTILDGGNFDILGTYFATKRGVVTEERTNLTITSELKDSTSGDKNTLDYKSEYNVNNVIYYKSKGCTKNDKEAINEIKKLISEYGAVTAYMYMNEMYYTKGENKNYLNYFSGISYAGFANHAITIVGWDDNYSRENFDRGSVILPEGDGAWIVKNSYGTETKSGNQIVSFGDNGYNYISYYEDLLCMDIMAVNNVVKNEDDENLYTYATVGNFSSFTLKDNTLYFAQKYSKLDTTLPEELNDVTIYSDKAGNVYEIYYSKDLNKNNYVLIASGTTKYQGFENIKTKNIVVDEEFYIIEKIVSTDKTFGAQLFTTKNDNKNYKGVYYSDSVKTGLSFYSSDATNWIDSIGEGLNISTFTDTFNINLYNPIYTFTKSFSDSRITVLDVNNQIKNIDDTDGNVKISLQIYNISDKSLIDVKILDEKNNDVTNKFKIKFDESELYISNLGNINSGKYTLKLSYNEANANCNFTISKNVQLVTKIEIIGDKEMYANGKLVLNAVVSPDNAINKNIIWTSSNEDIATVNSEGIVTGITEGNVIITAKAEDGSNVSGSIEINVIGIPNPEFMGNDVNPPQNNVANPNTGINSYTYFILFIILFGTYALLKYKNKKDIFKKV